MLMRPWLSRWSWSFLARGTTPRRTRRRVINPVAARVQMLEPRVLLTASPVGSEFQVNTFTTGEQRTLAESPQSVAMDADGDFVVTWSGYGQDGDGYGIFAQRYNAAGVAQGSEFQVNTYTAGWQRYSTVAMDADGDFVVTWSSSGQDATSTYGIYAQRYNAAGVAQGSEFRVNSYTTSHQRYSTVAMDADGDFVVTWSSSGYDATSSYGIYAQRYNAAGAAQGSEFQVNTYTTSDQGFSTVAMDADGDFVVAWSSYTQDGSFYGIYAQRYNAAGVAQGSEFRVNTYTTNGQRYSTVAMDADGDFVVTWSSYVQDISVHGIYAQRYNAAGVAQGSEFRVNTYTNNQQRYSAVAMDDNGDFIVTWSSLGQDGNLEGIYAQRYNAAAVAQGSEFRVNTYTTNNQFYSTVAMDNDGNFVVTWSSFGQDGSSDGVYAQRFGSNLPNLPPVINNQTFAVAENRPIGHVVGTVVATDPDPGQSLTYAITAGNTGNVFAINANTGQITVASPTLNFEGVNPYNLTVQVTDNGAPTSSSSATVTVNITNLNEAPTFLAPTTFTISENRPVGQFVGDVNTSDPEGNTVTYSIIGGDPNAQFAINATTGVITVAKATINFETTPQFLLSVKAQDNGSPANSRTQTITVNIANLNEAPAFLTPTTFTISENRPVGQFVGDVNTSDPEGNTVTYSIVGG
ncbi:MAG: cadherin repeat domain-containing protein, partial [Planctomycetaceae bacterium]|nr:cadherin repeat domain-containing protein [Planctomycetaceae bacterium]